MDNPTLFYADNGEMVLYGEITTELIDASLSANEDGRVLAYFDMGKWHYVPESDESRIRANGHLPFDVYVDEA